MMFPCSDILMKSIFEFFDRIYAHFNWYSDDFPSNSNFGFYISVRPIFKNIYLPNLLFHLVLTIMVQKNCPTWKVVVERLQSRFVHFPQKKYSAIQQIQKQHTMRSILERFLVNWLWNISRPISNILYIHRSTEMKVGFVTTEISRLLVDSVQNFSGAINAIFIVGRIQLWDNHNLAEVKCEVLTRNPPQ